MAAIESPTHSVVDVALRGLPMVLPVLDFSTIKNELFPVIATVFSRTNSLAIKVRGLQAFVILCGGSNDSTQDDGLDGLTGEAKKTSSSSALDKYTMQEKIIPLVKAIKTKEPAVMMAALTVLRVVGKEADADFVAMDILPILWSMSLGPLLELKQFQTFMELIKVLSKRVEDEQTKKLQELSGNSNGASALPAEDFMAFGGVTGTAFDQTNGTTEDDFERLVKGKVNLDSSGSFPSWDDAPSSTARVTSPAPASNTPKTPAFSWSTPSPTTNSTVPPNQFGAIKAQQPTYRTVTPDLGRFEAMTPATTQFSQPLQPSQTSTATARPTMQQQPSSASVDWSSASAATANPWSSKSTSTSTSTSTPTPTPTSISNYIPSNPISPPSTSGFGSLTSPMASMSMNQRPTMSQPQSQKSAFSLPPPPAGNTSNSFGASSSGGFSLPPPPGSVMAAAAAASLSSMSSLSKPAGNMSMGMGMGMGASMGQGMNNAMGSKPMGMAMNMGMNMSNNTGYSFGANSTGNSNSMNSMAGMATNQQMGGGSQPKSGLDKYESLL
jgi:SCY1-like protein 2